MGILRIAKNPSLITHDIVLIVAGHTRAGDDGFGVRPVTGVRLTLVIDRLTTPYSGTLPGQIARCYSCREMETDLGGLPLLRGVLSLAASGYQSSLTAQNAALASGLVAVPPPNKA